MRIAVLGAGSWGTTVASLLAGRHDCTAWARDPDLAREISEDGANSRYLPGFPLPPGLRATADLEKALHDVDLVVVGVPTHGFRAILTDARPYLRPWIPVVSLAKGFERGSLLRMTQLIREELPGHPAAALTGPNLAKEIVAGQAAASVIATEDLAVARTLQSVLQRGMFRIYLNDDVIGCELGGALKNVVAIATGIAQGLGVGDNTRAAVVCRGLAELTRLGVAMGGQAATFAGLAGMGDLIATCMSPLSRNRTLGEQLGAGKTVGEVLGASRSVAEGVNTAATAHELARRYAVEMPVSHTVYQVLTGEIAAADAYRGLTRRRPAGHEREPG
ncbi:MAG: NAD(P)H-dependent glycerol-3-phosphate dehydrogenase [Actinobacteria bacterium]|nr:NAD(P)H-dependent glycerol-3-phosphate dehydrogenase [Actinomycetota bacterium]